MAGWVKLYRELIDKPIWQLSTAPQKVVLITVLMEANHSENKWEFGGKIYNVKPGQFVTSAEKLAQKCGRGITRANVRSALTRFEQYEFLTTQTTKVNTLVTVVNWANYQGAEIELTNQLAKRQPSDNQAITTNKNVKNDKNEKNKDIMSSSDKPEPDKKDSIDYLGIIKYLNQKSGKRFRDTSTNRKLIKSRMDEGFTRVDIKNAIDYVVAAWGNDPNMNMYIRPSTIFRASKFESYANSTPYPKGSNGVIRETLPDWAKDDYKPKVVKTTPEKEAELKQTIKDYESARKKSEERKVKESVVKDSKPIKSDHTDAPDWVKALVNPTGDVD